MVTNQHFLLAAMHTIGQSACKCTWSPIFPQITELGKVFSILNEYFIPYGILGKLYTNRNFRKIGIAGSLQSSAVCMTARKKVDGPEINKQGKHETFTSEMLLCYLFGTFGTIYLLISKEAYLSLTLTLHRQVSSFKIFFHAGTNFEGGHISIERVADQWFCSFSYLLQRFTF